jgi:hypothetical protein
MPNRSLDCRFAPRLPWIVFVAGLALIAFGARLVSAQWVTPNCYKNYNTPVCMQSGSGFQTGEICHPSGDPCPDLADPGPVQCTETTTIEPGQSGFGYIQGYDRTCKYTPRFCDGGVCKNGEIVEVIVRCHEVAGPGCQSPTEGGGGGPPPWDPPIDP